MERKEPYASQEEFNKRVVHYPDVLLVELVPNFKGHILCSERMTVVFVTMAPNAYFPLHRHESEQVMMVVGGEIDEIVEGKLYHLKKGDVCILPSNTEHGGYISDKGCQTIEAFSPPRQDYVAKLKEVLGGKS